MDQKVSIRAILVNEEDHRRARIQAVLAGQSMQEYAGQAVMERVQRDEAAQRERQHVAEDKSDE